MVKERQCALCTKSFINASKLARHMLSHTTERLHKCEHSKKSYKKIFARNKLDHERIFFLKRALNFFSAELMTFRMEKL